MGKGPMLSLWHGSRWLEKWVEASPMQQSLWKSTDRDPKEKKGKQIYFPGIILTLDHSQPVPVSSASAGKPAGRWGRRDSRSWVVKHVKPSCLPFQTISVCSLRLMKISFLCVIIILYSEAKAVMSLFSRIANICFLITNNCFTVHPNFFHHS